MEAWLWRQGCYSNKMKKKYLPLLFIVFACSCDMKTNHMISKNLDIQGHRGCRGLMPENTIAGFIKAVNLGVTTLELDLSVNGDGDVIVSHEPFFNHEISTAPDGIQINKANQLEHNVYKLSQEAIEKYDVGLKHHERFPRQKKIAATKPTLQKLVKAIRRHVKEIEVEMPLFNMEIKRNPAGDNAYHPIMEIFADKVIRTIDSLGVSEITTVQCFDVETLNYLHKKYNHPKLVFLVENKDGFDANMEKLEFVPAVYSPDYKLVDKELVKACKEKNILLIPWTVNEEQETIDLINLGVDGIISDYPDMVIEVYESME